MENEMQHDTSGPANTILDVFPTDQENSASEDCSQTHDLARGDVPLFDDPPNPSSGSLPHDDTTHSDNQVHLPIEVAPPDDLSPAVHAIENRSTIDIPADDSTTTTVDPDQPAPTSVDPLHPALPLSDPAPPDPPRLASPSKRAATRSEIRLRRSEVVEMAHRQARSAGYEETTEYMAGLIAADRRGPGIRMARHMGEIGLTLSALHDRALEGTLPLETFLDFQTKIMGELGRLLRSRIDPDRALTSEPRPPRRRVKTAEPKA